jgi:hypothetical protein
MLTRHNIGHQLGIARLIVHAGSTDLLDLGIARERSFNFSDIDSETSNFDLEILPSKKFKAAIFLKDGRDPG